MAASKDQRQDHRVRVWDLPVRLFHWALVALLTTSYLTGQAGGDWMTLHFWSGYSILSLVLFRIVWGFVGSTTARFTNFVRGPSAALGHLRELLSGHGPHDAGHNPMGGAMVVALLFAVLLQAIAGLFSADTDTGIVNGPLARLIPNKWVDTVTDFHGFWVNVILAMAALHVLAVLTYLIWKRQNLIGAMLTGHKPRRHVVPDNEELPVLTFGSGRLALALLVLCAGVVYLIVRLGG
jgi:cytochrome b